MVSDQLHHPHFRVIRCDRALQFLQPREEAVEIRLVGALAEFVAALVRRDVVGRVLRGGRRRGDSAICNRFQAFFAAVVAARGSLAGSVEHRQGNAAAENSPHQFEIRAFRIQLLLFRFAQNVRVFGYAALLQFLPQQRL